MKKRNIMTMALSLAMVGVIGVGSTLAYLTAQDGTLTNTFKFADNIKVDVYEGTDEEENVTVNSNGGSGVGVNGGIDYTNLIPFQVLDKDVDLDVETTFETYLYVNIKADGEGTKVMKIGTLDGWTPVTDKVDENGYGIYRKTANVSEDTDDINVFDKVTVPDVDNGSTEGVKIKSIVIDVWAAQASAFKTVTDADTAAVTYFTTPVQP